jgi:hypothetical protein
MQKALHESKGGSFIRQQVNSAMPCQKKRIEDADYRRGCKPRLDSHILWPQQVRLQERSRDSKTVETALYKLGHIRRCRFILLNLAKDSAL